MSQQKRILQLPSGTTPAVADIFLCVQDVAGTPVTRKMTFSVLLTLFSTLFKGSWSGATTYAVGEIVESGGSAYQCLQQNLNHAPPNATYWRLLVSKGATGAAGSVWRNGSSAPDNALGVDGDFYLRTPNDDIYKKAGGVYSIVGNFKGATGDVREWIVGSGAPTTEGEDGDWYLDGATGDIYGPKADDEWPGSAAANIRGPAGADGVPDGGTAGQLLVKASNADQDAEWASLDPTLEAFATLTIAANTLTIGTGADAFAQTAFAANTFPARASTGDLVAKPITDFGLSLVDDADAAAARTTLGLGSAAVEAASAFAAASHAHAASDITSGTVATARLGSGTANSSSFLRGDQTWAAVDLSAYLPLAGGTMTGPITGTSGVVELRNSTTAQTFRVYGAYTDGSNYVRASLSSGTTSITLSAQTAGTGADDVSLVLTQAGTGGFIFTGHGQMGVGTAYNTGFGLGVFAALTSGVRNTALGRAALQAVTSGGYNTAMGVETLSLTTTGSNNVALGYLTLQNNTTGSNNVGLGTQALNSNTTGDNNMGIGDHALSSNTTGTDNVGIGISAGQGGVTTGSYNVSIGKSSQYGVTSGSYNIGIGREAGYGLTTGTGNVGIGNYSNNAVAAGSYNSAIGWQALYSNTGSRSVAIGYQTARNLATGDYNIAIGDSALYGTVSTAMGTDNIAIGRSALVVGTTAADIIAIGNNAAGGSAGITGGRHVFIGAYAGRVTTSAQFNVGIGYTPLYSCTTGGANIAIGRNTLYYVVSGSENTAVGDYALYQATGSGCVGVGSSAGANIGSGNYNFAIGYQAMSAGASTITGSRNFAFGTQAGNVLAGAASDNMLLGNLCGPSVTTGIENTFLGNGVAGSSSVTTGSGNVFIGYGAGYFSGNISNTFLLSNYNAGQIITGDFSTGKVNIGWVNTATPSHGATLHLFSKNASDVSLKVQAAASVTGDMTVWQKSDGTTFLAKVDSTGAIYSYYAYTDGSNYKGVKIGPSGASSVALTAITSGSYASDNVHILLTPAGSGNVGIGTSNPGCQLTISGASANAPSGLQIRNTSASGTYPYFTLIQCGTSAYGIASWVNASVIEGSAVGGLCFSAYAGDLRLTTGGSRLVRLHINNSNGFVGIGTESPTSLLAFSGDAACSVGMERHTSAGSGYALTIQAGGAKSGETNTAGGDLVLSPGLSTGTAESGVQIKGCPAGASSTTDGTLTTVFQVLGDKAAIFGATPVGQADALTTALGTVTCSAPGTQETAITVTDTSPFGFGTEDEALSVVKALANAMTRIAELETAIANFGITA